MDSLGTSSAALGAAATAAATEPEHAAAPQLPTTGGADAAAALVELSGVSPLTVEDYEQSMPPTLAAAAALADEMASTSGLSSVEQSSVFTELDRGAVMALVND